ncbi:MAG: hypothetical protein LBL43_06735 [Treponema sp.]|jgi:hypothetical protein|nr:hypothetical protein [Treponema sp.]
MGQIKSALEIALERTESVKGDRASIEQFEAKQRGKKLANDFLGDQKINLESAVKGTPKEEQRSFRQGLFDVFLSQIALPLTGDDMGRLEALGKGLAAVIGGSHFGTVYKQLIQLLNRYLDEAARYEEAIRQQYAPKLRQKEEELSRRLGRQLKLDPFQDPEFIAFYNQNMNNLKANYEGAITQVRAEAERLFGE